MRSISSLVLLLCCVSADAQLLIQGKVLDSESKEPLPFVNISVVRKTHGTTTGIDGIFQLEAAATDSLLISYVGYNAVKIPVPEKVQGAILLQQKSHDLEEIEISAGENPAFRIIRQAIDNAGRNDPERLPSFSYKAYHKLYATAEGTFDTIEKKSPAVRFFENHYLFLNETFSQRNFVRSRYDKETIVGNRMSGVKDPFFAVLGNQFQSFGFYKPHITLLDQSFVNPLSPGTFSRYDFVLENSVITNGDTSHIISFAPLSGKTFNALKGIITINSNHYAIENIQAQPADDAALVVMRIQQKYIFTQGHWFPQELNSEFVLREQKVSEHPIKYVHRTYITGPAFDLPAEPLTKEMLNLEFADGANKKDEVFWSSVRVDSLSAREQNTYTLYDSMPVRTLAILNTFVKTAEAVAIGKIKAGRFYIPMEHLLRNNGYEGLCAGLGLQTGETISKIFMLEGFAAYGFRDDALKYGGAVQVYTDVARGNHFRFSFLQDVFESGNPMFLKPPPALASAHTFRNWLAARMDSVTRIKAQYNFRPLRFLETSIFLQQSKHNPTHSIASETSENSGPDFTLAETGIQIKFIAGEQFSQIRNTRVISGFKYPIFDVSISRAMRKALDGDFDFTKVEARFYYELKWRGSHKTQFEIAGGMLQGSAPYFSLFNGKGTNTGKFDLNAFLVPNYFQTMKVYEFTADRYAYFFLIHDVGRIVTTRSKFFRPELSLHQNIGYGDLSGKNASAELRTFDQGFYESGFSIRNLMRINYVNLGYIGIGGGLFYRYGTYKLADTSSNLAGKINVTFSL